MATKAELQLEVDKLKAENEKLKTSQGLETTVVAVSKKYTAEEYKKLNKGK